MPISTPPPVSSNLPSPKLPPPSPLNTKLQSARLENLSSNVHSPQSVEAPLSGATDQMDMKKLSHMWPREMRDENSAISGGIFC